MKEEWAKMSVLNKVALKSLEKNKSRTLISILGVILASMLITAITSFSFSLQDYMIQGSIKKYGDWTVKLINNNNETVKSLINDERIDNYFSFENLGYGACEACLDERKPYIFVAGFDQDSLDSLPLELIQGRMPQKEDEIVIPMHLSLKGGVNYQIGERIEVALSERRLNNDTLSPFDRFQDGEILHSKQITKEFTVVGMIERPSFEENIAPGFTFITKLSELDKDVESTMFIKLKDETKLNQFVEDYEDYVVFLENEDVLRFKGLSSDKLFNRLLYALGAILTLLVTIGSFFLIYNAFSISLNQRMHEFGLLMSIGATEKQIRRSVLFEAFVIGLVGIPIGIILGLPSIKIILNIVESNFSNVLYDGVPLKLTISNNVILLTILFSYLTIIISAYVPAKKVSKKPIMDSIKEIGNDKIDSGEMTINPFFHKKLSVEGLLAYKNYKRNKNKYKTIVFSLVFSVLLFVTTNAFSTNLQQAARKTIVDNDYDVCACGSDLNEEEMFKLVKLSRNLTDTKTVSYQAVAKYKSKVAQEQINASTSMLLHDGELNTSVQFLSDDLYKSYITSMGLSLGDYYHNGDRFLAVGKTRAKDNNDALVDLFNVEKMTLEMVSFDEKVSESVVIKFVDEIPYDLLPQRELNSDDYIFLIVAPYSAKDKSIITGKDTLMGLTFTSENPETLAKSIREMISKNDIHSPYEVINLSKILEQNRNIIFIVNLFTLVFVSMISLISVANVYNTISTSIRLRRREIAMLKSIGMSDRSFYHMMRSESLFLSLKTIIISIPLSLISSYFVYSLIYRSGAPISYMIPYKSILISLIFVIMIIFITTHFVLKVIQKDNTIDVIKGNFS